MSQNILRNINKRCSKKKLMTAQKIRRIIRTKTKILELASTVVDRHSSIINM